MPIIVAHEETCDIIVNGPTAERPYKDLQNTMMMPVARPCTCGGVQYRVERTRWARISIASNQRRPTMPDLAPCDAASGLASKSAR